MEYPDYLYTRYEAEEASEHKALLLSCDGSEWSDYEREVVR